MRKYRVIALSILSVLLTSCLTEDAGNMSDRTDTVPSATPDVLSGQLIVRFDPGVADVLEKAGLTKCGPVNPMRRSSLPSVDEILDMVGGYRIERIFPLNSATEEKSRKCGLHLWYLVRFDQEQSVMDVAEKLSALGEVSHVEYNRELKRASVGKARPISSAMSRQLTATAESLPFNDRFLPAQWHIINKGNLNDPDAEKKKFVEGSDVQVEKAWELCKGDPSIIVAILDEGVDCSHPDLKDNIWVNEDEIPRSREDNDGNGYAGDYHGYNFVQDSGVISVDSKYDVGHGTHVAGVISAMNNNGGVGISSIAGGDAATGEKGVKIMPCQIFAGSVVGSLIDEVRAIKYAADNGAVILQCSWGYTSGAANGFENIPQYATDEEWLSHNKLESQALDYFVHYAGSPDGVIDGGVVVFAAGNEYAPAAAYPGAYPDFVSVAAFAGDFTPSVYTNYGKGTTICAPGGDQDYYYEYGEGRDMGTKGCILSTIPFGISTENPDHPGYGYMEGTSMACPHVSGVLALGMSYAVKLRKHFKADELRDLLHETALPIEPNWEKETTKFYYKYVVDMGHLHPMTLDLDSYRGRMGGQVNAYGFLKAIAGAGTQMTFPNVILTVGQSKVMSPSMYFVDGENLKYEVAVSDIKVASAAIVRNRLYIEALGVGQTEAVIRTSSGVENRFVITVRQMEEGNGWL